MGPRFPILRLLLVAAAVLGIGTMAPVQQGIALTPAVESESLDLNLSSEVESCIVPAEFLDGFSASPEAIDAGGPMSCVGCLACVVAAGICVGSGWTCVVGIPSHLWTGILAGCVGLCLDCVNEPQ